MPVGGSHKRLRQQPHSVQLSLPPQHQHEQQQQQGHHFRWEETGSKTPSSQHHQLHHASSKAAGRQLSLAMLMTLKRRLREVRVRLQAQAAANAALHGRRVGGAGRGADSTYRTQPLGPAFAAPGEPGQVLRHSLQFFLGDSLYCPRASARLVRMVAEDAKRRLKSALTGSRRFKLVVTAGVAQKARQGCVEASRCLLDASCDGSATASLDRPTFVASAAAYWFYYE